MHNVFNDTLTFTTAIECIGKSIGGFYYSLVADVYFRMQKIFFLQKVLQGTKIFVPWHFQIKEN